MRPNMLFGRVEEPFKALVGDLSVCGMLVKVITIFYIKIYKIYDHFKELQILKNCLYRHVRSLGT